jgi:hypothetical protein
MVSRKEILIVIAFVFLILSVSYWQIFLPARHIKTLSNITEPYSLFTPSLKNQIDAHLSAIDCIPMQYYFDDSYVCFVCDDFDACFGYGWVLREGGKKINPTGITKLENVKKFSVKNARFFLDDLTDKLNCNVKNTSTLQCDFSVFIVFQKWETTPIILLLNRSNFSKASEVICTTFNKTLAECSNNVCACGNTVVYLKENGEIFYGFK